MKYKTKSTILSLFDYLPSQAFYLLTKYILKSGVVNFSAGIPEVWHFVESAVRNIRAESLVEFGAGRHLGLNLLLSRTVNAQTIVDIDAMIDIDLVQQTFEEIRQKETGFLQKSINSIDDLESNFGISYKAPINLTDLPVEEKYDASISISTWEHIPVNLIPTLLNKLHEIIKPGGHLIAHIDYSDHYAHSDPAIDRLHFLSFTENDWQRFNHHHLFQNRLRHSQYFDLFTQHGFRVIESNASNFVQYPLKQPLAENLTGFDTDYATTGRWILINDGFD